jgi:hypothetical protein
MTKFVLTKEKNEVSRINPKRLIIAGKPKIGKTTLISTLPDCLTIDLEDGSKSVSILSQCVNNIEELRELCTEIYKARKNNTITYKYIAIDTVTKLEEWAEIEATENYMNSSIGKNFNRDPSTGELLPKNQWDLVSSLPNGAGYYYIRMAFKKWLNVFDKLADHIILVSHIKDKYINDLGKEVNVNALDLTGKLANIVAADADALGYLYIDRKTSDLVITFDSKFVEGGSRMEHLRGKTFPIIEYKDSVISKVNWNLIYKNDKQS